ncbi:hypothetical protein JW823_00705 [bacterium]|nr:hypothetical protein [candidate division CSSED10-310 bacterium]
MSYDVVQRCREGSCAPPVGCGNHLFRFVFNGFNAIIATVYNDIVVTIDTVNIGFIIIMEDGHKTRPYNSWINGLWIIICKGYNLQDSMEMVRHYLVRVQKYVVIPFRDPVPFRINQFP